MENISERKHVDIYCHVPHMEVYHKNIETFFLNWMKSGNDLLLLTVVHSVIVLMLLIFVQWFIFKCIYQNTAQIVHRAFEPFPNEMPSLSEVCVLVIITWNPPNEKKRNVLKTFGDFDLCLLFSSHKLFILLLRDDFEEENIETNKNIKWINQV